MFKIGEFSRIGQVTIDTLRHYDAIGLLTPAKVDSTTGYRYYLARQLESLNRIIVLKEVGFSLAEIARILREELSNDELRGMLKAQLAVAENEIEVAQLRRMRIQTRLKHLDQEAETSPFDITLKSVDPQTVVSIRETIPAATEIGKRWGQMFQRIGDWIKDQGLRSGPAITFYHNDGYHEANIDTECAFVIYHDNVATLRQPEGPLCIRHIEAVPKMATIVVADYRTVGLVPAYNAVGQWIGEHGYRIIGAPRELYYGSPADNEFTAEIQFPVEME